MRSVSVNFTEILAGSFAGQLRLPEAFAWVRLAGGIDLKLQIKPARHRSPWAPGQVVGLMRIYASSFGLFLIIFGSEGFNSLAEKELIASSRPLLPPPPPPFNHQDLSTCVGPNSFTYPPMPMFVSVHKKYLAPSMFFTFHVGYMERVITWDGHNIPLYISFLFLSSFFGGLKKIITRMQISMYRSS